MKRGQANTVTTTTSHAQPRTKARSRVRWLALPLVVLSGVLPMLTASRDAVATVGVGVCSKGPTRPAPVCYGNQTCTADAGWQYTPLAAGVGCKLTNGSAGTCSGRGECVALPQAASVPASYVVLSVVYAPPGSAAGSKSSVDYQTTSSAGVSTSAGNSFKSGYGVEASATVGGIGGAGASFNESQQTGSTSEIDISKSTSDDLKAQGPSADGIDHNQDMIYLWLNPQINFSVASNGQNVTWGLVNNTAWQANMDIQVVQVSWLKNPALIPTGVKNELTRAGVTAADYATIMARDPFANGPAPIDPSRFLLTNSSIPYEPIPGLSNSYSASNDLAQKIGTSSQDSYTVGLSVNGGYNFGIVKASLKVDSSWTWTNTSSQGTTQDTKQSATVTIIGPSATYPGPTNIDVYWDTLYSTFLMDFTPGSTMALRSGSASVQGTVTGGAPNEPVLLTVGGTTHRTYTNPRGQYFFYNTPRGQGTVSVRGIPHPVAGPTNIQVGTAGPTKLGIGTVGVTTAK